jgi:cell division protein FtsI/penicillin-binding protein 2
MRLFYLQVIQGGKWKEEGDRQYKSELVEKAKRGKIYSSDGEILAFDVETYEVVLDPTIIKEENIDEIIGIIKKNIPNADLKSLKQNILQKKKDKKRYLKIDDKISYIQKRSILDDLGKQKYLKLGVFFESFSIRSYTKNDVFKEIVGFQNSENEGLYGVEKYYNDLLKGKNGWLG